MPGTFWILEEIEDVRFPYRLRIVDGEREILCLRVQEKWPGTKGQIFCLNDDGSDWPQPTELIEKIPVVSLRRYGKRLAVVLDRTRNKRCDFLFLKKPYKTREGEYEQIFWRTQRALRERRPRVKLTLQGDLSYRVLIDSIEKYPWRFPGCEIERAQLPVGDYALIGDDGLLAVVERKTFENVLAEFGRMSTFHQVLSELELYRNYALVIEAAYSDFLSPGKMKHYRPSFAAKAMAEIQAMHPKLPVIFAGNRKLANEWTRRFFSAIESHEADELKPMVAEALAVYQIQSISKGGIQLDVKMKLKELPERFTIQDLRNACPGISDPSLRKVLRETENEGKLIHHKKGKSSYWEKRDAEL